MHYRLRNIPVGYSTIHCYWLQPGKGAQIATAQLERQYIASKRSNPCPVAF